jgi:hypothetical protein
MAVDATARLRSQFLRFADLECDRSPLYRALATTVAENGEPLALAAGARHGPTPNLFLAAVHDLLMRRPDEPLAGYYSTLARQPHPRHGLQSAFTRFALAKTNGIEELLRVRLVQTNEVRRAVALYTALAWLAERECLDSLALVEIGSSAGLLLAVDRYAYRFGTDEPCGSSNAGLTLATELRGRRPATLLLDAAVSRRIGIDLHVLDLNDESDRRWLRALVWGDQPDRLQLLDRAIDVARHVPLEIHEGDATTLLPDLIDGIDEAATVVVFHSHALNQFPAEARAAFDAAVARASIARPVYRIAMEYDGDLPAIDLVVYQDGAPDEALRLARYDAHGAWLEWLASDE